MKYEYIQTFCIKKLSRVTKTEQETKETLKNLLRIGDLCKCFCISSRVFFEELSYQNNLCNGLSYSEGTIRVYTKI